jgi:hypothetical protein
VSDDSSTVDAGKDATPDGTADASADVAADVAAEAEAGTPGLFVSATSGDDTNPGTLAKPFKTIKHAFTIAKSGDTVVLLPGVFGAASGDDFSTAIPDGVTLAAQGLGGDGGVDVTLQGAGTSLAFAGSGAISNVALIGFSVAAIVATTGTQTLTNVSATGIQVVAISTSAHLTYTGGTITSPATAITCTDNTVLVASNLTVTGVTNRAFGINGACNATVSNSSITNTTGTGFNSGSTGTLTIDTVDVDKGAAVIASTGSITIKNGSFTNSGQDAISPGSVTLDITGTTITGCGRYGIETSSATVTATNMTISGCALGGIYSQSSLKLRGCTLKNNVQTGVYGLGSISWDLGTGGTPGNNIFQGNGATNIDISIISAQTINAVGNTWNVLVQGSDNAGHYASGVLSGFNQSGTNFKTSASAQLRLGT